MSSSPRSTRTPATHPTTDFVTDITRVRARPARPRRRTTRRPVRRPAAPPMRRCRCRPARRRRSTRTRRRGRRATAMERRSAGLSVGRRQRPRRLAAAIRWVGSESPTCQNAQRLKGGACQLAVVTSARARRAALHQHARTLGGRSADRRGASPILFAACQQEEDQSSPADTRMRASRRARQPGDAGQLAAPAQPALGVPAHARDHPDPSDRRAARSAAAGCRADWATSRCRGGRHRSTVTKSCEDTLTDALLVLHDGRLVEERYFVGHDRDRPATCDVGVEVDRRLRRRSPGGAGTPRPARGR